MAEHIFCAGCRRKFTLSGHTRHLAQTSNPQCIAIYQELNTYLPASDSDSDGGDIQPDNIDNDRMNYDPNNDVNNDFGGDYFGTYEENEFDWPDGGESDDSESETDEEEPEFESDHDEGADCMDFDAGNVERPEGDGDEDHAEPEDPENLPDNRQVRDQAEQHLGRGPYIDAFPLASAGKVLNLAQKQIYKSYQDGLEQPTNKWAPFASQIDYELARWAKLRGSGSTAFSDLLKIEGMCEQLGLSYKDSRQLNQIIDKKLPARRPQFQREEIEIAGESFDVYFRDILECVKALYGDPEFARYLVFTPERHYSDADRTVRMYHDLHTGKWWWDTQNELETKQPGATIIPIILSSDKTQVTMFRNKSAYPIYMTIGNIPKDIRRKPSRHAQILLAYLPTTRLDHITNQAASANRQVAVQCCAGGYSAYSGTARSPTVQCATVTSKCTKS
ncbi:hypothetical protein BJ138DRAFT_1238613 [Hygrophoropsis aurantiaca]|uniref:Uncharacterized protein n=1 Tax=Hygrophoropsis aurantiaca TaxID=72124 RepID=A0ACB7ZT40_9AGAM|nr:hypothetical protein BJ138DRAFT_1238613 [Hygrophoropsis aurantiaca]